MAQKSRKTNKKRGSRTCGWGNAQKHRGAGSRGGRGMSGSKKQKWSYVSKNHPGYFGRKGFKRPLSQIKEDLITNVGYLNSNIEQLVQKGLAKKEKDGYYIDITQTGYTKLLGAGKVDKKINVKVDKCTPKAKEKIEVVGGSVEVILEPVAEDEQESNQKGE